MIGTPALAADMSLKAPPPAPARGWAGFYAGAQFGGLWDRGRLTETTGFVPSLTGNVTTNGSGIIGGGHIGCNWQRGNIVFGPEADLEGTSLNKTSRLLKNSTRLAGWHVIPWI
jgi:outer membrane immunogenic protein